ncbi:MAG: NAD-dependent epimerase/dehydratase family protein [Chloroflexi bacterium]|nr:MAG: NAD-dependent epimerase/dehydratase family protein [Chloroflexota bacterium]TMG67540.1 MAG: NAD-dependent epimerase/dehydratase family protein [Chloroflexota bacterium]
MATPFRPQRVLVTGVSNPLGAEVARRLAPQVPLLFGCDVADPVSALEEMDFVHADTRLSVIGKLIRRLRIDTVVHLAVMVDAAHDDRSVHETDVIGTMNVLVGCAPPSSPVRKLVVKSSQAIYGAGPNDPSFFSEEMINWDKVASGVTRDVLEMEQLVSEFALRNELCGVTVLRLGLRVSEETSLARYLSLPVVPTFAGFDPRLQLLHEDDAADAIVRATVGDHPGAFNVAGDGVVLLSQAIDIMGGTAAPVLPPYARWFSRLGLRLLAGVDLPSHLADVLAYGSVMDCSRLPAEFDWHPGYSTRQAMDALARGKQVEVIEAPSPRQEYELQVYLQQRRRRERQLSN